MTFVSYLGLLTWPVRALGFVVNIIQRGSASLGRINKILDARPEIKDVETSKEINMGGDIVFHDVSFSYPTTEVRSLSHINLTVPAGSSLGIIGKTGSGKTTLVSMLVRLFDPSRGFITIGGTNLKDIPLATLREAIGFVPQESFLFSATITENIGFSFDLNDYTEDQIVSAAKAAYIDHNIREFPDQYETFVGERGVTLSGGQKQRISMARAIVKEPKILVFDDSLSAVDTVTEEIILQNLKTVMTNRTSIVISHRISSIKNMDHIIVLQDGAILEEGTHEELIALHGAYYELYRKQMDETYEVSSKKEGEIHE